MFLCILNVSENFKIVKFCYYVVILLIIFVKKYIRSVYIKRYKKECK